MSQRIEDYAIIGDLQTCALVGRDGSIDWLCVPRFDSPACFAALLGTRDNGAWRIAPAAPVVATRRRYRGDSLVAPIETGRYPSAAGTPGSVPWSGVAVYSPLEFRARGTYRIDVEDARQRTARIDLLAGTLEAIRRDFDRVLW